MKKTVSPAVAIALIVVVVIIAVYLFTRAATTKKTQFVPGVGVIGPDGKPVSPRGGRRGEGRGGPRGGGMRGGGARGGARGM